MLHKIISTKSSIDNIIRHPIDVFQKYKYMTKSYPDAFSKYCIEEDNKMLLSKLKPSTVFNDKDQEIKINMHLLINKKNISSQDEDLYEQLMSKLNKINNRNFDELSDEIINLEYTKTKHIHRLAESILIKSINEMAFSQVYAKLCLTLLPCYIKLNDNKVYFKTILLIICQDMFNELTHDSHNDVSIKKKQEFDRQVSYESLNLSGLMNFFGHLSQIDILPTQIISFCFDKLIKLIERKTSTEKIFDGIKNLIESSRTFLKEKDPELIKSMQSKIKELFYKELYIDVRTKFTMMDIMDLFN
jgi:hypothetical protein